MDMSNEDKPEQHIVLLEPPRDEGSEALLVSDDGYVEHGYLRDVQEGKPLNGSDMIQVAPHPNSPLVWRVKDRMSFREGGGPAKYTSRAYRNNYDQIFGKEKEPDALLN
jgi:hypothetical protein